MDMSAWGLRLAAVGCHDGGCAAAAVAFPAVRVVRLLGPGDCSGLYGFHSLLLLLADIKNLVFIRT